MNVWRTLALVLSLTCAILLFFLVEKRMIISQHQEEIALLQAELNETKEQLALQPNEGTPLPHPKITPPAKTEATTPNSLSETGSISKPTFKEEPVPGKSLEDPAATASNDLSRSERFFIAAKVSSVEKFVPLTAEQRDRLTRKFTLEAKKQKGAKDDLNTEVESLESIIGSEESRFYQEQRQAAFDRSKAEAAEKEFLYMSRILDLSRDQEGEVRAVMNRVESEVELEFKAAREHAGRDPQKLLQLYATETEVTNERLAQELKPILSEEQYRKLIERQATAPSQDVSVWH